LGGIHVEVIRDVVFRLHPVGALHAREMVRQVRGFPLLAGTRGEEPSDLEFLEQTLMRLSLLVSNHPGISEIEINPLLVAPAGGRAWGFPTGSSVVRFDDNCCHVQGMWLHFPP
jgi:acetyltransferase